MTSHMPGYYAPLAALTAVLVLAGCGSRDDGPSTPVEAVISFGSFGTKADLDCGQGKSLSVGGSNNTLKVTGACASVSVSGADNTITLERVDGELTVVGLNNTVTYRAGEPAVDDSGTGNRVSRS